MIFVVLVQLLSPQKWQNRSLFDKSMKLGGMIDLYVLIIF